MVLELAGTFESGALSGCCPAAFLAVEFAFERAEVGRVSPRVLVELGVQPAVVAFVQVAGHELHEERRRSILRQSIALSKFLHFHIHFAPPCIALFLVDEVAYEDSLIAESEAHFPTLANRFFIGFACVLAVLVRSRSHLTSANC